MPKRTNEFQRLIAVVQSHLDSGSTVTESAMLRDVVTGTEREVDIVVMGHVGAQPVAVSIECRKRSRRPSVTWVEEMHTKHSRLPTNVLVLAAHKPFSKEAVRVANIYGIRCLVLDEIDADAPNRLFPTVQSVWGKAWQITIQRVTLTLAASGELPSGDVMAHSQDNVYGEDGTLIGSVGHLVVSIVRSKAFFDRMNADAQPDHKRLELEWPFPNANKALFSRKIEARLLRRIERVHILANCTVAVDEFPLRHANFDERLRVAWGTGDLLGKTAIVVATAAPGEQAKVSVKWLTDGDTAMAR